MKNEKRGSLSFTLAEHHKMGSTGSGFESLIQPPLKPDVPYGEQMTPGALQKYYEGQLGGLRMYFSLTPEQREMIMSVAEGFEADLPYLKSRGIDVQDAMTAFEQLKGISRTK